MEHSEGISWETRFDWTLTALMLGAFGLAIFLSGLRVGERGNALWAALVAGAYVIVLQATPRKIRDQRLAGEILATVGIVATLTSVVLTQGDNAGYILLVSVPIFYAAAFMGFRIGMETALLATFGLLTVLIALDADIAEKANSFVFYLLIGVTFSQARRLLVIERETSDALRAASAIDAARVERLESAHSLLVELADVAGTNEFSAVTVGETALHDLAARIPMVYGAITSSLDGAVVAEWGAMEEGLVAAQHPIQIAARHLGDFRVWHRPQDDLAVHREVIDAVLVGVALAFDNVHLLQTVAKRSIQDERTRVARELHDDIGPALASLGLGLDIVTQAVPDGPTGRQIQRMRASVTDLVERVRSTVAALRREDTTTVLEHIHRIAAELGAGTPDLMVNVEEQQRADGDTAAQVGAILVEAVRNAAQHASAATIRINGYVGGSSGRLAVVDDGKGFDASADYPGHFGLVGMRERAAAIGGSVNIRSIEGQGTTLTVVWGTPQKTPS